MYFFQDWSRQSQREIQYIFKGHCQAPETTSSGTGTGINAGSVVDIGVDFSSALQGDVNNSLQPHTMLNMALLYKLRNYDRVMHFYHSTLYVCVFLCVLIDFGFFTFYLLRFRWWWLDNAIPLV